MKSIVANWKMNVGLRESLVLARAVVDFTRGKNIFPEIILCPSFVSLDEVKKILGRGRIQLGAQLCATEKTGAFTGEVSPQTLKDIGCGFVLVGHSERRIIFGETNELVRARFSSARASLLTPILCVGELLAVRQSGDEENYVTEQLESVLVSQKFTKKNLLYIAYEPVWAIGAKEPASIETILGMHLFIRTVTAKIANIEENNIRVLYGGAVTPENAFQLLRESEVDGLLVGGASTSIRKFERIIKVAKEIIEE